MQTTLSTSAPTRAPAPSLDTLETTIQSRLTLRSRNGHRLNHTRAEKLYAHAINQDQLDKAERVDKCGTRFWVAMSNDGPILLRDRCHQRCCPECQNYRGRHIEHELAERMAKFAHPKFLTLTQAARREPLGESIDRLLRSFSRLRRYAAWKSLVRGGVYVVEITRHPKRYWFHVHLHVLMDADYLPQTWLADTWESITGDSRVCHIRAAKPSDSKYLAKYVAKGGEGALEDWELWPYLHEIHGRRLAAGFGSERALWRRQGESDTYLIGRLEDVITWAQSGNELAQWYLSAIVERYAKRLFDTTHEPDAYEWPLLNWNDTGPPGLNSGPSRRTIARYREGLGHHVANLANYRARHNRISHYDLDR